MLATSDLLAYNAIVNNRQRKTFEAVFREPAPATIAWNDIESLLLAVGCELREGSGSRVRFMLRGRVLAVHRPHPQKEAKQYLVRDVREFLSSFGVKP